MNNLIKNIIIDELTKLFSNIIIPFYTLSYTPSSTPSTSLSISRISSDTSTVHNEIEDLIRHNLINSVTVSIGNDVIHEYYRDWENMWKELTTTSATAITDNMY